MITTIISFQERLLTTICFLVLVFCITSGCQNKRRQAQDHLVTNPKELYNRDKEQISKCFINNVEYYRLYCRYTSEELDTYYNDSIHSDAQWDPANFYEPYACRYNEELQCYINSPIETIYQLKVEVDTILYDNTACLCFAFLSIYQNYKNVSHLKKRPSGYDAKAIIGIRKCTDDAFNVYPVTNFIAFNYTNKDACIRDLKYLYSHRLKGSSLAGSVYQEMTFNANVGDSRFFEDSPFFQPFDERRLNCQMYKHLGKIYEYNYHYMN